MAGAFCKVDGFTISWHTHARQKKERGERQRQRETETYIQTAKARRGGGTKGRQRSNQRRGGGRGGLSEERNKVEWTKKNSKRA